MLKVIAIQRSLNMVQRTLFWNIEDIILARGFASSFSLCCRRIHDLTLLCIDAQHCHITEKSVTIWPTFGSNTDSATHWQLGGPCLELGNMVEAIDPNFGKENNNNLHNIFITTRGEVEAAPRIVIIGWLKAPFADHDRQLHQTTSKIMFRWIRSSAEGTVVEADNLFKLYCKFVEKPRDPNSNVLNGFSPYLKR
ncbi:putative reverse transcriptase-7 [Operophtera brumata]|uniref:Putative reverse transcriptase-7 n=1 Tax=Operophtera brumata TaxID=104452 RepID=A0A0L7KLW8_OPEBR|nr:putative reverse transcriptase-7 [Operophtera brumata]